MKKRSKLQKIFDSILTDKNAYISKFNDNYYLFIHNENTTHKVLFDRLIFSIMIQGDDLNEHPLLTKIIQFEKDEYYSFTELGRMWIELTLKHPDNCYKRYTDISKVCTDCISLYAVSLEPDGEKVGIRVVDEYEHYYKI